MADLSSGDPSAHHLLTSSFVAVFVLQSAERLQPH